MIKRPAHNSDEFSRDREFSVILERIHSDFRIFGEDMQSVKADIKMLKETAGRQEESMFMMRADINVMKRDIVIMKADIVTMKADISVLKTDVGEIKVMLKGHDKRLTVLEAAK